MSINPSSGGRLARVVQWWRRQTPKTKLLLAAGVVALIILGNLMEPKEPLTTPVAGTPDTSASPSATAIASSEPEESVPPQCTAAGTPPPAPDASGPLEDVTLGKLTCRFKHGKLDDAEVSVTVRNQGDGPATYTVTVQLLDASGGVVKTHDAAVYGLEAGDREDATAILVGWGEAIETDGDGYWVRATNVERVVQPEPEPLPTGDSSTGGDVDDVDMPEVHPGGFCGTPGAKGVASGRVYTCRDGHWRR